MALVSLLSDFAPGFHHDYTENGDDNVMIIDHAEEDNMMIMGMMMITMI